MEINDKQNLRILALYHNAPMIYAYLPKEHQGAVDVKVSLVSVKKIPGGKPRNIFSYNDKYEYTVRVSALLPPQPMLVGPIFNNGNIVEELKWEGPLEEWYLACAEVVKSMKEDDNAR